MSNPIPDSSDGGDRDRLMSAMFASMVIQNANMALIFLGQAPNPQTGETAQDLENARYFIDQLEIIEARTRGNLNKQEETILKQSLTNLRLAFVEAVEHPQPPPATGQKAPPADSPQAGPATDEQEMPIVEPTLPGETAAPEVAAEPESKKKFTKKY
ncbi:MAG TPA: DUF1844 domain-containing protein [Candidatus Baltobacteraceae bacterium]|nr:DUF1844 domain-containing protein [Candidatus Baltobacteraceae bacterium]